MPIFLEKVEKNRNKQNILIPVANVSCNWIVFKESLISRVLLGDREHPSGVSSQVPDCRVARGRVQPGWVVWRGGWEGVGRAHENIKTGVDRRGGLRCNAHDYPFSSQA